MKKLYDDFSGYVSKKITHTYSTSFTLGIKMLGKELHFPIYAIYGLVRAADEIVDSFHDYNKAELLSDFKRDTYKAINDGISLNPILNSFQQVVNDYNIPNQLIEAFFKSMEMDLHKIEYNANDYHEYIYGSAEVVGLMCLMIFANGNQAMYNKLEPGAKYLGAAFQKVNFLRDAQADFEDKGRVYFPNVDFIHFSERDKQLIEQDIEHDFNQALPYIMQLPKAARAGVYLAYTYYLSLFKRIQKTKAINILKSRIRVPNYIKLFIWGKTYVKGSINVI